MGGVARVDGGSGTPVALVRTGAAAFTALSLVCTHEGTTVNITGAGFLCPNHGARFSNVGVEVFHGLLVDYAKQKNAKVIVRGIRAVTDYEYEFQMALMNRRLEPEIETVFMMPAENYSYLSSRLVKEIAELGGSVSGLVPEIVEKRLKQRFKREK